MDLGLEGRTALVFGASSGLGLATAEALSSEGVNVALVARRGEIVRREADRLGGHAIVGDVTVVSDLERAVDETVGTYGGLDILLWNHGGPPPGVAKTLTPDVLDDGVRLMLEPLVRVVKKALPHLMESSSARIIAITSLAALEPTPHLVLSNTLRPAVHGYLKTLANELGPDGITVNCLAPGRIATARLDEVHPEGPTTEALAPIALKRWGTPDEFADIVCFIASSRAAYITGQTIVVDGGMQELYY